jgi:hypothetical protein
MASPLEVFQLFFHHWEELQGFLGHPGRITETMVEYSPLPSSVCIDFKVRYSAKHFARHLYILLRI